MGEEEGEEMWLNRRVKRWVKGRVRRGGCRETDEERDG